MNTLHIFFSEFWPFFVLAIVIMPLLQWGRHMSLDGTAAVFVSPHSFRELSPFAKEEQQRLLREADREAFPRWRFFLPALIDAAILSGGLAMGRTAADSAWVSVGLVILFVGLAGWLAGRLEARFIRPYLKVQIERTHPAT